MKVHFEIVKAEVVEFEVIQTLAYEIWPSFYASIISFDQIEYMLRLRYSFDALLLQAQNGQEFFLAKQNGISVGFIGFTPDQKYSLKIDKLYLIEESRGKGFGKTMIRFVEERAKVLGAEVLFLNVHRFNASLQFYKKVGFEVIENVDIPFGPFWLNDFILQKKLIP